MQPLYSSVTMLTPGHGGSFPFIPLPLPPSPSLIPRPWPSGSFLGGQLGHGQVGFSPAPLAGITFPAGMDIGQLGSQQTRQTDVGVNSSLERVGRPVVSGVCV